MEEFGEFSSSSTSNNTPHGVEDCVHEKKFVEGLFLDENNNNESQNSDLSHEVEPRNNEEINSLLCNNNNNNNVKGSKERKSKGFKDMIKGQWTEEEDRMLKTLVLKYGERKWAMIARSHLVGRAGKQCRERWHNHLRPDIKKDAWDEEEERMLVSAHQQFGNKWAEIARRIPGRSENSIKNHWNATKRRQNSKKKSKTNKVNDDIHQTVDFLTNTQPSTILQDYIKTRYPCNNKNPTTTVTTTATTVEAVMSLSSTTTNVSGDPPTNFDQYYFESPTSLTIVSSPYYEEEVLFMQQLFSDNNNNNHSKYYNSDNNYSSNNLNYYYYNLDDEIVDSMIMDSLSFDNDDMKSVSNSNSNSNSNNSSTCLYSDKFLANLLDGRSSYHDHDGGISEMMMNSQPFDQMMEKNNQGYDVLSSNTSTKKKDVDLFEMILSPNYSESSSNYPSYY
ncbi:hypothetical protein RND81_04G159100 [Saponaria officinalis]|uniref:Uncharacterized protein n=1 Tax=Saponaria officinalis TaxID=3572 RepID=A0AAW1LLF1_SAPOF